MRRPSFNPFMDYPFSSWLKREPRASWGRRGRKNPRVFEGEGPERRGDGLQAKEGHPMRQAALQVSESRKEEGQDPVLSALHLAKEEVFARKDYGREVVVVTRDGRKLRYEKGSHPGALLG